MSEKLVANKPENLQELKITKLKEHAEELNKIIQWAVAELGKINQGSKENKDLLSLLRKVDEPVKIFSTRIQEEDLFDKYMAECVLDEHDCFGMEDRELISSTLRARTVMLLPCKLLTDYINSLTGGSDSFDQNSEYVKICLDKTSAFLQKIFELKPEKKSK